MPNYNRSLQRPSMNVKSALTNMLLRMDYLEETLRIYVVIFCNSPIEITTISWLKVYCELSFIKYYKSRQNIVKYKCIK
jgi:hypothetical protein